MGERNEKIKTGNENSDGNKDETHWKAMLGEKNTVKNERTN